MKDGLKDKYRQAIIEILSANPRLERAVLFGSRAMETFTTTSDVDIALFGNALTLDDLSKLAEKIDELSMPQRVDLLLHHHIKNKKLLEHIEQHGVEWVRRDAGCDWKHATVDDLIESGSATLQTGPFGTVLKAAEYSQEGVPLISVREIREGYLDITKDTPYVNSQTIARLPNYVLRSGDIVFGRKGGVDRNVLITPEQDGWFLGSDGIRLRISDVFDRKFLSYQMRSSMTKAWLLQNSEGTTMPSLNQGILGRIPLVIPPLSEQRAIAHILGTLDDRIELNRKMNQTLEEMARAIFKSWFVDFNPVSAKAEGRKPAGMDAATAALFPDSFEDSELGKIPKGWRVDECGNCIELAYGKGLPKEKRLPGPYPVFGSGGQDGTHESAIVQGPGIVVGRKGTIGTLYWVESDFYPIDTTFFVKMRTGTVSLRWVFEMLNTIDIARLGADSAVPGVNRHAVYAQPWIIPSDTVCKAYNSVSATFLKGFSSNSNQAKMLTQLRDTLLPKLLSGELRIKDAEKFVEAAT